jgi:hypothetical protein
VDNRIPFNVLPSFCQNIVFKGKSVEYTSNQDYTWYGELEIDPNDACGCKNGFLLLVAKNGEKTGQIQLEDEIYTIEDIGGKQLITKMPTDGNNIRICGGALEEGLVGEEPIVQERNGANCDIKILVLYTPAANAASSNIEAIGANGVKLTNEAFRNSNIPESDLKLILVWNDVLSINETGLTMSSVLGSLPSSPIVQAKRNLYNADLVVLLVDGAIMAPELTAGLAYLGPSNYAGYGVVKFFGANSGFVFSHEVGHMLGAHHETCDAEDAGTNCNNGSGFNHAHTWSYETGCLWWKKTQKRKTIMHSGGGNVSDIIQYFSNPLVNVSGNPTGIPLQRDNAATMRSNACTIANFRTGDIELSATIVGENKVCRFDLAQLTATVSGPGLPTGQSYQYEWKHNLTGTNWDATPVAGTNSALSIASGSLAVGTVIFARLKVTTPNGTILYDFHSIQVFDHHIICERFEAGRSLSNPIKASPNPASSSINVTFFVEERSDITINLYTTNGVLRKSVAKRTFDTGTYTEMVDLSDIENSFNYIEVINGNKINRLPIIVIK